MYFSNAYLDLSDEEQRIVDGRNGNVLGAGGRHVSGKRAKLCAQYDTFSIEMREAFKVKGAQNIQSNVLHVCHFLKRRFCSLYSLCP